MTSPEARALEEALRRLLSTRYDAVSARATDNGWPGQLWESLAEMGVPWLGIPAEHGGSGGGIANTALAYAPGLLLAEDLAGELVVSGSAEPVGWATHCEYTVAVCARNSMYRLVILRTSDARIEPCPNIAGELRDRLTFDRAHPVASATTAADLNDQLLAGGAAARSIAISGVADRVLELSVEHARTRRQFGKPIGAFQAVAHLLARIAGATVAAQGAAALAVRSLQQDDVSLAAAAKIVAGEAAGTVAELAHQVRGAIGMTREHDLHRYTRRLWAWRDEYGSDRYWARRSGTELIDAGPIDNVGDPWHDLVNA